MVINCNSTTIDLSKGHVMGILNVTPDSFYDGGQYKDLKDIVSHAKQMLADGATFIDVGGESSKPGSDFVDDKEQIRRVIPAIRAIKQHLPKAIISVDTTSSVVAEKAVECGASMINDISAGSFDDRMLAVVASLDVPYIAMHMQGTPRTMQNNPTYKNVVSDVYRAMEICRDRAMSEGVRQFILDVGFGFGKTLSHNYELLRHLDKFQKLGHPLLVGVSRKSMIQKPIDVQVEDALNGTTVVHTIAALQGASILRVHDVKEAVQVFKLVNYMNQQSVQTSLS
jgi:dihydropteroate synthase